MSGFFSHCKSQFVDVWGMGRGYVFRLDCRSYVKSSRASEGSCHTEWRCGTKDGLKWEVGKEWLNGRLT